MCTWLPRRTGQVASLALVDFGEGGSHVILVANTDAAAGRCGGDSVVADVVPGSTGHKDIYEDILEIQQVEIAPPNADADAATLPDLDLLLCQKRHHPHPVLSSPAVAALCPPPPSTS